MDRFVPRMPMVAALDCAGLLLMLAPIVHSVGHSERLGVLLVPRLSTQWFVCKQPLAVPAIMPQLQPDCMQPFVPARLAQLYLQWMENIQAWVISRQLWWGHQIPAWTNCQTGETYVGMVPPMHIANWCQDPAVLELWFSAALWPFSTMGWPKLDAPDTCRYTPTELLEPG